MEYYLCVVFTFIAFICAFLSGVVQNASNDKITKILEENLTQIEKLIKLRLMIEKGINPFSIIILICYLFIPILLLVSEDSFVKSNLLLFLILYLVLFSLLNFILIVLGKRLANKLLIYLLKIIIFFYNLTLPFTLIANKISDILLEKSNLDYSREEINALIETSHETGSIETDEYRILKNIMKFSTVLVSDIMTPRTVVFNCEADAKVSDVINLPEIMMYSRFPIWDGDSFDNGVIGYVLSKDILAAALRGEKDKTLREFRRDVYFIPENAELDKALEMFLQRRQHLFVVVDEYGGVEGLLTMEDVMETILGVEIVDEADKIIDLRLYAKQQRDKRIASKIQNQPEL